MVWDFFFLVGQYIKYDTNLSIKIKSFQSLIKSIADVSQIGLHPSYASNTAERYLLREKQSLEKVTHRDLTMSRQHFLFLRCQQIESNHFTLPCQMTRSTTIDLAR